MSSPALSIQPERLRRLLHELIDIYSPSGKEEEILEYLRDTLSAWGLPLVYQAVDGNRFNLVVLPPETEVRVALVGHVDTVVAYELDHFGCEERGDLVMGLGAADMKGGCAAMIEAYLTAWEQGGSPLPAALALVVGEEEEGDGARRLVREFDFPWAVIGEPTDLQPCLSDYGYLEAQITTRGRRIHASLAKLGNNPIEAMLRFLLKVAHHAETERPEMVYNIRELSSSHSGFAVPDRCDAWLDIHLPPSTPLAEVRLEIEELLARERQNGPEFEGRLRFATIHAGYELHERGPVIDALKSVFESNGLPWKPSAFPSHSDANLLRAAGVKPVILGPGRLEQAHAPDESVSMKQVLLAAQLYRDLLGNLSDSRFFPKEATP